MSEADSSPVSGVGPLGTLGSAVAMAETRVAGRPDSTACPGSVGPNNDSADDAPIVVAACSTALRVRLRSVQASVSSLVQVAAVAYPASKRGPGSVPPAWVNAAVTTAVAG